MSIIEEYNNEMGAWIIMLSVCAAGHTGCQSATPTWYYATRQECERMLTYMPQSDRPQCEEISRRKANAEGAVLFPSSHGH